MPSGFQLSKVNTGVFVECRDADVESYLDAFKRHEEMRVTELEHGRYLVPDGSEIRKCWRRR